MPKMSWRQPQNHSLGVSCASLLAFTQILAFSGPAEANAITEGIKRIQQFLGPRTKHVDTASPSKSVEPGDLHQRIRAVQSSYQEVERYKSASEFPGWRRESKKELEHWVGASHLHDIATAASPWRLRQLGRRYGSIERQLAPLEQEYSECQASDWQIQQRIRGLEQELDRLGRNVPQALDLAQRRVEAEKSALAKAKKDLVSLVQSHRQAVSDWRIPGAPGLSIGPWQEAELETAQPSGSSIRDSVKSLLSNDNRFLAGVNYVSYSFKNLKRAEKDLQRLTRRKPSSASKRQAAIFDEIKQAHASLTENARPQKVLEAQVRDLKNSREAVLKEAGGLLSKAFQTAKLPWPDFTDKSQERQLTYSVSPHYVGARMAVADIQLLAAQAGVPLKESVVWSGQASLKQEDVSGLSQEDARARLETKLAQYEENRLNLERAAELATRESWLLQTIPELVSVFEHSARLGEIHEWNGASAKRRLHDELYPMIKGSPPAR